MPFCKIILLIKKFELILFNHGYIDPGILKKQMVNNMPMLRNKNILLVGAMGSIGSSLARNLIESGANVIALDIYNPEFINLNISIKKNCGRIIYEQVDITDKSGLDRVFNIADSEFGGIDGAVNTAYPRNANYGRDLFDVDYLDFCENVSLHLGGYFLFMQACAQYSIKHGKNFSLVNFSSIYGSQSPKFELYSDTTMTMPVEYAAIKAGLEHLTRYFAAYFKGQFTEFRANCVSPGGIFSNQDPKFVSRYKSYTLSKGMLDSNDIAGTVIFLLSDASRYIVGQNIIVDDGFVI